MIGRFTQRSLVALALMAATASLTVFAAPNVLLADRRPHVKLQTVIPESFAEWRLDEAASTMLVEPELQQAIDAIYAETVSRVYMNQRGERIMLSIAYGRNQSDSLQVHMPEGCYAGQGFAIGEVAQATLATPFAAIPTHRMVAERQSRQEAVTYWVVVGNRFGTDEWERKKIKLAYALDRTVPDGTLVRVSSISGDSKEAFQLQQRFIEAMLGAMPAPQRQLLLSEQAS